MAVTNREFNANEYLVQGGIGKSILEAKTDDPIFCQGDPGDAVLFLLRGQVVLTIVSPSGREATIQILNPGQFVGEECLTPERTERHCSAKALSKCTLVRIAKSEMIRVLREEPAMVQLMLRHYARQKTRMQADLVNHLFYTSEERLALTLLQLAQPGKNSSPHATIPRIRQETLAEIVGTTRSRVSYFMNRFRKKGLIDYGGPARIQVNNLLRAMVPSH